MTACETVLTRRRWHTGGAVALAVAAAVSLGGCAAGKHAQTVDQYSVVDGVTGNVGPIGLRDAGIAAPKDVAGYAVGDNAELVLALANNGTSPDQLVSVTSSAAASVVLTTGGSSGPAGGSAGGSAASPAATSDSASPSTTPPASAPASPSTTDSGASAGSTSATGSASSASAPSARSGPINIPANGLVRVGAGQPAGGVITMTGLKRALTPGVAVPVTFTFASAGRITLQLPVKLIGDATGGQTVTVSPSGE